MSTTTVNKSNRFAALLDDNDGGYREKNNNRRNGPSGTNGRNRQQNGRGNRNVRRNSNSSNDNNYNNNSNNNHLWNKNSKGLSIYNNEQKYQNQPETTSRTSKSPNTINQPPIPLYPVNENSYAKRLADKKEASIKKEVVIDKKWTYVSVKDSTNKITVIRNNDVDVHVDCSIKSIINLLNNKHRQRVNEYMELWGEDEYERMFTFPNYEYGYFDRLDEELLVEEELRNNNSDTSDTDSE
jgi:hypothetical protein